MSTPPANPCEPVLFREYNAIKQQLMAESANQMNSAFKINSNVTLLVQGVLEVVNSCNAKMALLQQENGALRAEISRLKRVAESGESTKLSYVSAIDDNFALDEWETDGNEPKQQMVEDQDDYQLIKNGQKQFESQFFNLASLTKINSSNNQQNFQNAFLNLTNSKQIAESRLSSPPPYASPSLSHKKCKSKKEKLLIKQQFNAVAQFVREALLPTITYNPHHMSHAIPKKQILKTYFRWCKQNNRETLLSRHSTIQMALTNELKALFPQMDCYTKDYRGLQFIATARAARPKLEKESVDSLTGRKK